MVKTVPGKFERGKIIPLKNLGDIGESRIYITVIPITEGKTLTENQFLTMAKRANALFRKGKLRSVASLKELDQ